MTITTIYTCDRCAASQTTSERFWKVGVSWAPYNYPFPAPHQEDQMQVCQKCAAELGLVPQNPKPAVPLPIPSLEDLIREIIQSELNQ
jgi:hypothetical protein